MSTKAKKPTPKKRSPKQAKGTARRPKSKSAAQPKGGSKLLDAARDVLPKLQSGKTTLSAERDRLGLSGNGPLRKALTELLGGKAQYSKMMEEARATKRAATD